MPDPHRTSYGTTTAPLDQVRAYVLAVLAEAGYPNPTASQITEQLVDASLRGVDSHGVAVLLPLHAQEAASGRVDVDAVPHIERQTAACATIEGGNAPGATAMALAGALAHRLVSEHGLAAVSLRNIGYLGDLYHFVRPWAEEGLIAFMMTNAEAEVAPHLGRVALHGTNPLAFAFPAPNHPLVIDMRTNSLRRADYWNSLLTSSDLPAGTVLDKDGLPIVDPAEVASGVLLPLAGPKGYGLALAVDLLTAGLSGGLIGQNLTDATPGSYSAFLLVMEVSRFGESGQFDEQVSHLSHQARAIPPLDPAEPVRLPGDRGEEERRIRSASGIPLDPRWGSMVDELRAMGIATPIPWLPPKSENLHR